MWDWIECAVLAQLWPHGLQPTRLLNPWDSPGKNTGVGCHALLQGIFTTQGSNPGLPHRRLFFKVWASSEAGFLVAQTVESACNVRDPGLIPGLGISPGEGKGNPFHYTCLENPMDLGAWRATAWGQKELDMIEQLTFSIEKPH